MSINKIRTIFIGTPDFGIPSLKALLNDEQFDVVAVISQPDKKVGRKQILTPSPIKQIALEHNLTVWQPEKIKNEESRIKEISPDLIVVVAYAKIIPQSILDIPKFGCVNIHGSLLPLYRGAACIQQALLDGKSETGITIMLMDKELDTGTILSQHAVPIKNNDTAGTLFDKLSLLGGENIISTLNSYIKGDIKPIAQDDSKSTYVGLLKKDDGKIKLNKSAETVERFIRAMSPWPGAFIEVAGKKIKILKTVHAPIKDIKHKSGELFCFEKKLYLKCTNDALEIEQLQLEGKKISNTKDFICGHSNLIL